MDHGFSPIQVVAKWIDTAEALEQSRWRQFQLSAIPPEKEETLPDMKLPVYDKDKEQDH